MDANNPLAFSFFIQFRIPFQQKLLPTFTMDHPSQLSHVETPSRASW